MEERIRKGNVIYRTRLRDVEDTVAQLLHDEDQSIASAAVLLVEERGPVVAGRRPRARARASRRARSATCSKRRRGRWPPIACQAERRKELWQEPLPAVELADRLRRVPLFDFTHVDELFRLARLGRQVRYEKGRARVRARRGRDLDPVPARRPRHDHRAARPRGIDGAGGARLRGAARRRADARRRSSRPTRSITLSLTADEFLALLSENVELAEGIFRMLIATRDLATGHTLIHGDLPPDMKAVGAPAAGRSRAAVAVEPAAGARHGGAIVAAVGDRARTHGRRRSRGAAQGQRGRDPDRVVGHAESRRRRPSPRPPTAGDVIGMYETLAGSAARCDGHRHHRDRACCASIAAGCSSCSPITPICFRASSRCCCRRSGRTISNTVSTP